MFRGLDTRTGEKFNAEQLKLAPDEKYSNPLGPNLRWPKRVHGQAEIDPGQQPRGVHSRVPDNTDPEDKIRPSRLREKFPAVQQSH